MDTAYGTAEALWYPAPERIAGSNLKRFQRWLSLERGIELKDAGALFEWSIRESEAFWSAIAVFFGVRFHREPTSVLEHGRGPAETRWFPGATLNYAEHLLRFGPEGAGINDKDTAVLFCSEYGTSVPRCVLTRAELLNAVSCVAAGLRKMRVGFGDRVVGYLPNGPQALVAFLASASLGAIWSNCPPELSSQGVLERLKQIEPRVLFAVCNYRYGGKTHDRAGVLAEITAGLPTLRHVVMVSRDADMAGSATSPPVCSWTDLFGAGDRPPELHFQPVPFDHPLWILFSSGTTGAPKPIVHGHGGILLEHLKSLSLHLDLQPGDKFFWFTSAGWMMWNFLLSGLALGVTIVLYDGSPKYPDLSALWRLVEKERITYFGTSAPFLLACQKAGLEPGKDANLEFLRAIGSTGAPLPGDCFRWVYEHVKRDVWLGSVSGGTDLCTAFVLSHPWLPVYPERLQCRGLGAPIEAWDEDGKAVWNQVGELVLTAPMPCMPVCFWNDPDDERLWQTYFSYYRGVWRHGDWIEICSETGQCVIYGRSDSTLNRGGVRMGSSEFYNVVELLPEVEASLVIDTTELRRDGHSTQGQLLLFVVLSDQQLFNEELVGRISAKIRSELSPRYVPDAIFAVPEIPLTLNGKKLEIPVKRIFQGTPAAKAVSREAMSNPDSLQAFVRLAEAFSHRDANDINS
ncbi:MAG TPA: acetoacetate--CoA ligase [Chthoniobacterales bacterium]